MPFWRNTAWAMGLRWRPFGCGLIARAGEQAEKSSSGKDCGRTNGGVGKGDRGAMHFKVGQAKAEAKPIAPAPIAPAPAVVVEAKPARTRTAKAKPVDSKPVDAKPVDAKAVGPKPASAEPAVTKSTPAGPAQAEPARGRSRSTRREADAPAAGSPTRARTKAGKAPASPDAPADRRGRDLGDPASAGTEAADSTVRRARKTAAPRPASPPPTAPSGVRAGATTAKPTPKPKPKPASPSPAAPSAARSVAAARSEKPVATPRPRLHLHIPQADETRPTVARWRLGGTDLPLVEETLPFGELVRRAALAQFGTVADPARGQERPLAPSAVSGRGGNGRPLADPRHRGHIFWLPEDADRDGRIDHLTAYLADGFCRATLQRLDGLDWVCPQGRDWPETWTVPGRFPSPGGPPVVGRVWDGRGKDWRLVSEGVGRPSDFADSSVVALFGSARVWRSRTPFFASGHLKRTGYAGEIQRLLDRRGLLRPDQAEEVEVIEQSDRRFGDRRCTPRAFHSERCRAGETRLDDRGAFLVLRLPVPIRGPLLLGYGAHFGLGQFQATADDGT